MFLDLKKINPKGWIGAIVFALIVGFLTYVFGKSTDNVNCVYSTANCISNIEILYKISNPLRIMVAVFLLGIFVYMPTNYLLMRLKLNK